MQEIKIGNNTYPLDISIWQTTPQGKLIRYSGLEITKTHEIYSFKIKSGGFIMFPFRHGKLDIKEFEKKM